MFVAADFADKLEKWEEDFWEVIDSWLLEKIAENDLGMVATSVINLARTSQRVGSKVLTGTVADLLRLGTFDPDDTSAWGITKSIGANALRLISVVGPAGRALGFAGRYAGLVAASKLKVPAGSGPCTYAAANNVISLLRGKTTQVFASLDDILRVRGIDKGWVNSKVAKTAPVQALFNKHGIFTKNVTGLQSLDDVLNFARRADGPVTFGIKRQKLINGKLEDFFHELTAVKDPFGKVKILDYFENKANGFRGYDSFEKFWRGYVTIGLDSGPILQYSSHFITALKMADGAFVVAIPFVVGVRPNGVVFDMAQSVSDFLRRALGGKVPESLPDLVTNPQDFIVSVSGKPPYWYTVRKGIPKEDWLSSRAGKDYGDMLLWPLIFEATQAEERKKGAVKFVNQNKMWEGQQVFVPDISGVSADRKAAAKARGRDWKRVG